MKVPLSWLRDHVELTLPEAELAERLTLAGLEVASVRTIGVPLPPGLHVGPEEAGPVWPKDKIVIGQVLSVERHPNADRLTLATIEYGAAHPKTVVTGAPNLQPGDHGQKVILALAGSVLFDGHTAEKVLRELKPSKIRGVPSDAMVCSAYELGIAEDHEGIIILEPDAPVGMPLVDFMGDVVVDLDITPNLARCLSIVGVAREVAALTGTTLKRRPAASMNTVPHAGCTTQVHIEDSNLSARYTAQVLDGVKIGPSPGWMQRRLTYAGMRPINNIVDITNYVMLELGQPLHAFDFDVLLKRAGGQPPTITVRPARPGEKLTTLDNVLRELSPENLLITDTAGPIALAGVMGGLESEVKGSSTRILLESASFDFRSIRRTMKAFNLPSEASMRFSRGVHPEPVKDAAARAINLMCELAGARPLGEFIDNYPAPIPRQVIDLPMAEVRRTLGMDFPMDTAAGILRSLEFEVTETGQDALRVVTPPHRLDIQSGCADIIEDLVRIHGYQRLPATLLADQLPEPKANPELEFEERLRDLCVTAGLQEVITYALTEPAREAPLTGSDQDYVRLANPISSERAVMRRSVLASVLETASANLRHATAVRLFEIGTAYLPRVDDRLPLESKRLALVVAGPRQGEFWAEQAKGPTGLLDFFDLKGIVETLAEGLHLPGRAYVPAKVPYLHPGMAATVEVEGKVAGSLGVLHPRTAEAYQLAGLPILAGEFELEVLFRAVPGRRTCRPVPRYPAALRDIAVIVDESTTADQLVDQIRLAGGELLREIRLFDLYRGDSVPAAKKSLAFALVYQSEDRTLTDKEVDKAHKKIGDRLKHVLKAQIRGE